MSVGKSTGFTRLFWMVGCAVVFVCLGLFPIMKLPREVQLTQKLYFNAPFTADATWSLFFDQEKAALKRLVLQDRIDWPSRPNQILKKLSIRSEHSPPTLTISLRTRVHQYPHIPFQTLIDRYIDHRGKNEKKPFGHSSEPQEMMLNETTERNRDRSIHSLLLDQLKWQRERQEELTQQLAELKLEHKRLRIEAIGMKQTSSDSAENQSMGFNKYLKPFSQKILKNNTYLRHLHSLLEQTRQERDRLDLSAGQTTSPRQLSDLEDQLRKIHQQSVSLESELAIRKRQSLEQMRQRYRPQYRKELDILLAGLVGRKQIIVESLNYAEKTIAFIQNDLILIDPAPDASAQPAQIVRMDFCPPLFRPVPPLSRQEQFGRWRMGGIFILALFGGLIGMVVSGAITLTPAPKKRMEPKAKRENWLQESSEPLEPVVVSQPQTHPMTQGQSTKTKKMSGQQKKASKKLKINLDEPVRQTAREKTVLPVLVLVEKSPVESNLTHEPPVPPADLFHTDAEPGAMDQCEPYADKIESLQASTPSPFILISALNAADASPRFVADLAIVLQRRRQRVLLVEADQSSTVLAEKVFEYQSDPGFYQWRRGEAWVSQVSCETHLRDITFMPAGTANETQCDKDLDLTKEAHRWSNLKTKFDVVLLFCPSALLEKSKPPHLIAAAHLLDLTDGIFVLTQSKNLEKNQDKLQTLLANKKVQLLNLISAKK